MRPLRHPRDPLPPFLERQRREVHARDPHPPRSRRHEAQQHLEQRGLARPAGSGEGDALPWPDRQRDRSRRVLAPALVADRDPVHLDPQPRGRHRGRAAQGGDRGLEHLEDLLRGRQPLGGRVVLRPDLTQRQISLRRQDQDDQPGVQIELPVDQPHADGHGHQRHRERRQQFQGEGGEEGDAQGPHRRLPVVVGDLADRLGLRLGPAEDLQRRQPGHHVQEVSGQPGQQPPLAVHPGLGGHADQHHEERNQRQGDHDDGRRHPVLGDDPGEDRHRDDHREAQLGQVAREVVVEGVHAPGGQRHQRPGPLSAQPAGSQVRGPVQQPAAQLRLDRRPGPMGRQLREPGEQAAAQRHGREQQQRCPQRLAVQPLLEGADHDLGDQHRLTDDQPRPGKSQGHHGRQEEAGGAGVSKQARVDRFHVKHPPEQGQAGRSGISAHRRCAACRSACGTPSTSSPGRAGRAALPLLHTRS